MKTKVGPGGFAPHPQDADDVTHAIRMMGHVQSGMRQLCFGISAFLGQDQRSQQLNEHLAFLHEDEARYHAREAAWLRNQNSTRDLLSDSDGPRRATHSRSGSSESKRQKVRPLYVSVVPVPSKE